MNWIILQEEKQLTEIQEVSASRPQVIFKHSTRCSVSAGARRRLEYSDEPMEMDFYFLDILNYRPLSNKVAEFFQVPHESPQVLVIVKGECVYDESHGEIDMHSIIRQAQV